MKKLIYFIGIILLFTSCAYTKSSEFEVNIRVSYIYENNPDSTYTIDYKDNFYFNGTVTDLDPRYSIDAGWINDLILYNNSRIYVKNEGWYNYGPKKEILLIKSPDHKLKVVNITTSCSKTK